MEMNPQLQAKLDQLGRLPKAARIGIVVCLSILMGGWILLWLLSREK